VLMQQRQESLCLFGIGIELVGDFAALHVDCTYVYCI
jgi:hypothetical protein